METILNISNLNLSFISDRQKEESLFLFRDLSLEIEREKITALVGGNGAGKTTLFNVISGLQRGASGKVNFQGSEITRLSPYKIARLGIGRLFQGARVFEELSILDNMVIGAIHHANEIPFYNLLFYRKSMAFEKGLEEKAEAILSELFGSNNIFWEDRIKPAGNLSFGHQRLLAMARLLMGNYSLYLLDEPTAGVHVQFIEQIASAIRHMNSHSHKTVLLIEHNMHFVRQMAEYCLYMENGKIIAKGHPNDVLASDQVQQSYMGI
ncbi:MAG: ATP-binding cassette domain-containing protein [Bacteroidetes bacterium]|nr:ATP-binding cassette domain-containing protein [Bacteroidota bacterium]